MKKASNGTILLMEENLVAYARRTPLTEADFKAVNDKIAATFPRASSYPQMPSQLKSKSGSVACSL